MIIKRSMILMIAFSSLLFSCNKTKCYSSHDPCPPLCHTEGYFSWHDSEAWTLTENLQERGISEIAIEKDPLLREGFLYVRFEVECSDLSVFSFPNISFDQTYHSNYDSKKVENFAKEKSIDFHQSISSDKTKLMGGSGSYSIVPTEDGSLPSKKYKGDLTYAFRVENTLFDYAQDKTLEDACFFLSPFIKGDNRYCVFAFQDITLRQYNLIDEISFSSA